MVSTILPVNPDDNQMRASRLKIQEQLKTIEKLADISFAMFEELRSLKPDSRLLVKWRWVVAGLL
jgi:hypothetical protein